MKLRVLVQSRGEIQELNLHAETCIVVGRLRADLNLADGDASRRHAAFYQDAAGKLRVKDLGSLNGTVMGGRRIRDAEIKVGECVEIGSAEIVLLGFTPRLPPPLSRR